MTAKNRIAFTEMQELFEEICEAAIDSLFSEKMIAQHGWSKEDWENMLGDSEWFEELEYEEGETLH